MFNRKITRRALVRIIAYAGAALLALSLFSAVSWGHLLVYRRQTAVDADRAFEETVGALEDLSRSLDKSRYAGDGAMCAKVCAEIYADAGRAGTALSALPFSTVEMEELKRFISLSGDYAYTLCREAAEEGFTDEQRETMARLSDTAAGLAEELDAMRGELRDGLLTMDSREARVANVLDEVPSYLSARLGDYARDFPAVQELSYHGRYSAREEEKTEPVDEAAAKEQAAALLGCEPAELQVAARYEDTGKLLLTRDGKTVTVTAQGIESLRDARLVEESRLSEGEAVAAAEEALARLGCEGLTWEEKTRRGNVLDLRGSAENGGVSGLDREIALSVALDDGALLALDLSAAGGEAGESAWALGEKEARALLPAGLTLRASRRVTVAGADGRSIACWEMDCLNEKAGRVRIYLNAESGRQEEIRIG
ncbi:MAG: germination protein YpeB [Oscillospiraceae bacterium]|nr:germination protein YpeB [Oscillospiraceae bacterium]